MRVLALMTMVLLSDCIAGQEDTFQWPHGAKAAVSLAYDDALNSQLDNAIPQLDKYNLKASFYIFMGSPVVHGRLGEWKAIAENGHELGNHTLHHGCAKSKPNREWLSNWNDLEKRTIDEMRQHIKIASIFLQALDGKTRRTFTAPCADWGTADGHYLDAIKEDFVAIKGYLSDKPQPLHDIDPDMVHIYAPESVSGEQLIAFVQEAANMGTIANITFHGIGDDHMAVSKQAHEILLAYLAANREIYWTATFLEIMTYFKQQQLHYSTTSIMY